MAIAISILPSHILSKILQNNICTGENIHHIPPFMPSLYITELKYDFGRLSKKFFKDSYNMMPYRKRLILHRSVA